MEEDFGFYGSDGEKPSNTVLRGITDTVTNFSYTDMSYPCVVFKEGFKCAKHQMKVVSNMVKSSCPDKDITLYFIKGGEFYKMGVIGGLQVGSLLDMLGVESLYGYFSEGMRLDGSMLYSLCTS